MAISTGVRVGFGPGVAASAGPDALFGRGQAADLGLELIPEGETFALCCCIVSERQSMRRLLGRTILLDGALRCFLAADASYVFGDVVFGVDISSSGTNACDCACYRHSYASLAQVMHIGCVEAW